MTPRQVHALRMKFGDTAKDFANRLGLKGKAREVTVYRWESGVRRPSFEHQYRMKLLMDGIPKKRR